VTEDVTKLNNRNHVTSIAANAIGSSEIGEDVILDNKSISSLNYLPGVSGWRIDGYGNSEFANVVVRGNINAYSGTIGYWNISQPLVKRTFGDYVIYGTLLESSDLGLTDDGVTSGTYVGLFKSYIDTQISVLSVTRVSEIATVTVANHNYSVGDYVKVRVYEDSSFNTDSSVIVDVSDTTYKYYSAGSDVTVDQTSGYSVLAIKDIAGLYLRDYSKSEFDYGYFSNTGVAYVSAEDVNLLENPSFEWLYSGSPTPDTSSWTAGAGITFATEQFNDNTDPQYQYDSSYGGSVSWSSALSTYLTGRIDYIAGTSYNIYKSGRVLYLGMTMFPSYVATKSVPTAVARYTTGTGGLLYWRVDTSTAHGLSAGDTALLDFAGTQYDSTYGEWMDWIGRTVTGGFTRTYTVLSSPAPTSTRFYVDSGYSSTATLGNGVTLRNVVIIEPVNTNQNDFAVDKYGTRSGSYVYKVIPAAFNLSEVQFRFANGSIVPISDVISIETKSNWDTEVNKYLISDPTFYALGYNDANVGIPYMTKSIQTIVDANLLDFNYQILDPTSYAAGTDIYIDLPAWMYSHDGAGYVSASPTKIPSFKYVVDNLYLSTTTKAFFGGSLPNVRWYSSTTETPSYDPAQASIEGTKQWIDVNLDTQTAYLDYFNYVGFKQANFSRSMLLSPNITTSDSIAAKVVFPTDYEILTVSSGTYRYIDNGGAYVDLSSSLKTITGDRDTGFELVASKKYHFATTESILNEEYANIAGYWDQGANQSVVRLKAQKISIYTGGFYDYKDYSVEQLTVTSSGVVIAGNLTVNGYTTTVNSTTVTIDDKNIELASTASPSDALADGAGITVKGTSDKTWNWYDATGSWTSNQDINIVSTGTAYRIAGTSVLNSTTLGVNVVNSSLTKIGALSGGTAGYVAVSATGALTSTSASATMTTLMGFTTTVTSGAPVVLTNASTYYQQFTGSTAQTVTLPVTSTLATGWTFHIVNNNTAGDLTVNSSGGNLVITVIPGTTAMVTCIATAGTTAANWEFGFTDFSTRTGTGDVVLSSAPTLSSPVISTITNTGTLTLPTTTGYLALNPTTTKGDLIYASATGTPGTLARLAVPVTNGWLLTYNSTSGLAEWAAPTSSSFGYVGQTQTTASGTNMAVTGITSITGATGTTDIAFNSAATTSAASGAINVITGTTTTSGATGAVIVRSGNSAAASGAVTISTGTAVATTGGSLTLSTGNASGTGGVSGAISIATGSAGSTGNSGAITMDVGTKTTGSFGTITIGGTNASAVTVGNVTNTATATIAASTTLNLNVPTIATNVTSGTLALFNTGLTGTLNFAGAATAVNVGASTGTLTLNNPTIATSVTSGTLALFNTGLTGTLSIGGSAGTVNIATTATASKAVNIGTDATASGSTTINIGTSTATASTTVRIGNSTLSTQSDIRLQGAVYVGKNTSTSSTGTVSGYFASIYAPSTTNTNAGVAAGATGSALQIYGGDATVTLGQGNATGGNVVIDAGSANAVNGATFGGTISIGGNSSAATIILGATSTSYTFAPTTITINGTVSGYTLSGTLVGPTTTTSIAALRLPAGTVPSSANQQFGMIGADAESIQLATTKTAGAGPGFGYIRAPQMVYAIANSGAATTNTAVSPFASTNDVLSSLEVNKYYRFRGVYYFTSTFTSGTATIQLAFTFANGPVTFKYNYKTYKSTGVTAFDLAGVSTTNAATTVSASVTAAASYAIEFEGFFTSNATTGGSLTPQFQMSATGSSTIATAGSFFEIEKLNATGATTPGLIAGNWA
jgi:hypothetical protein